MSYCNMRKHLVSTQQVIHKCSNILKTWRSKGNPNVRLWINQFGSAIVVLNDDKLLLTNLLTDFLLHIRGLQDGKYFDSLKNLYCRC